MTNQIQMLKELNVQDLHVAARFEHWNIKTLVIDSSFVIPPGFSSSLHVPLIK